MGNSKKEPDALRAEDILQNPQIVNEFPGPYAMLVDGSFLSGLGIPTHRKLIDALNLLDEIGWETISICNDRGTMFALVRRSDNAGSQ